MHKNFHDGGVPDVCMQSVSLSIVTIDCINKIDKKYYPQVQLQCKYVVKKNKMNNFIDAGLELHSSDSDFK